MAIEDAILGGYYIPKGAMVLCNIRGAHHDPKYWENPAKLDPLRFLDDKGCFRKCRHYVPFSYGELARNKASRYILSYGIYKN